MYDDYGLKLNLSISFMATNTMPALSSLELMLEQIQKRDDLPKDVPPALPTRPVIRARLPRSRSRLPFNYQKNDCEKTEDKFMSSNLGRSLFFNSLYHLEPSDRISGHAAPAFLAESVDGSTLEFETRYNEDGVSEKDQVEVPYSVVVDLQRQVLKMDALLDQKREENASLRLQIKELERKWQQHEAKMKSMEKTWQDQLTSIQASLEAAKMSSYSKNAAGKLGLLFALPENPEENTPDSPLQIRSRLNPDHHRKAMSGEISSILIQNEPVQSGSSANPEEELQKLKLKFKTWKKNFKNRLVVAKTTIKKLGNAEARRTGHQKW